MYREASRKASIQWNAVFAAAHGTDPASSPFQGGGVSDPNDADLTVSPVWNPNPDSYGMN